MKPRHSIVEDHDFWSRLEFALTGWLAGQDVKDLRRFWIDGFIPEGIRDTEYGVNVEGRAWVGTSARDQSAYQFVASIPQSLLTSKNHTFRFSKVNLNPVTKKLEVTIEKDTKSAESGPRE